MSESAVLLIVEDDEETANRLSDFLISNGYRVERAANGHEALMMTHEKKPSLIILDAVLPKIDGFQVARLLKFDSKSKEIPILMLTVLDRNVDRERGKAVGVDLYLTKPFKDSEFLAAIKKLIKP